jgi:single-strand DNA-binding protein
MNKVILVGRIGTDPEVKYTSSNTAVCGFRLATTEHVKGEKKTEWHSITCFGKTAENVAQYCGKGSEVALDGRLETQQWEAKDGSGKRERTKVIAWHVEFIGSKRDGGGRQDAPAAPADDDDSAPF